LGVKGSQKASRSLGTSTRAAAVDILVSLGMNDSAAMIDFLNSASDQLFCPIERLFNVF
jgi:hypothetical protein